MIVPCSGSRRATRSLRDVRRTQRELIDEQELLLDAQRKVRRFAEVVLHGAQSMAAVANIVQPMSAKDTLIAELRQHAPDRRRGHAHLGRHGPVLRRRQARDPAPAGFGALSELVAGFARQWEATAVGGLTMGADAPACAALAGGADVKAFFVRKETKAHGLQRKIEGPPLEPGERCLIVEDVVTSGGSTVQAIEAVRAEGHDVVGVVSILDRLAGGAAAIALASGDAPYEALATIDDVYPDRPDRGTRPHRAWLSRAAFASEARRPRQESNLHPALRRRVLYPLSYEGRSKGIQGVGCPPVRGSREHNPPEGAIDLSTGTGASDLLHAEDSGVDEIVAGKAPVAARSPLQLFWRRFRKDKVALVALALHRPADPGRDLRAADPQGARRAAPERRPRPRRSTPSACPSGPSSEHLMGVDDARARHLLARARRRPRVAAGRVRRHRPVGARSA